MGNVEAPHLLVGFPSVEAGHPDSFALDLLASLLGSGSSSRMHKRIVYEMQAATGVSAYDSTTKDPGTFVLMASLHSSRDLKRVTEAIDKEIKNLQNKKISERELQKVKNQVMKEFVDGLDTADEKAQALAINEIYFGDYRHMFTDLEKYEDVTVEDIQRAAKKYLKPESRVSVVLNPATSGAVK
jgi:zinc protease